MELTYSSKLTISCLYKSCNLTQTPQPRTLDFLSLYPNSWLVSKVNDVRSDRDSVWDDRDGGVWQSAGGSGGVVGVDDGYCGPVHRVVLLRVVWSDLDDHFLDSKYISEIYFDSWK